MYYLLTNSIGNVEWGSRRTYSRSLALLDTMARLDLVILNEGNAFMFRRGDTGSVIDVTMASGGITARTTGWIVSEEITLSDHQYIEFAICSVTLPFSLSLKGGPMAMHNGEILIL